MIRKTLRLRAGLRLIAAWVVATTVACDSASEPARLPAAIEMIQGDAQEALGNETLPDSLRIRILDRDGAPIEGALVVWSATSGVISPLSTWTDASGVVAARWEFYSPTAGFAPVGTHHATAEVNGLNPATFTAYSRAGALLRDLSINPNQVDVASSDASVTVTVHATDDRTRFGLTHGAVVFHNPTATQINVKSLTALLSLTSGTPADGFWRATITVPQGTEAGTWKLIQVTLGWGCGGANRVNLQDAKLNALGVPRELIVTSQPSQVRALAELRSARSAPNAAPAAPTATRVKGLICSGSD